MLHNTFHSLSKVVMHPANFRLPIENCTPYFLEWLVSLACELVTHQQFMKKVLELSCCTRYFLFTGIDRLMGNGDLWILMGINNVPSILMEIIVRVHPEFPLRLMEHY